MMKYLVLGMVFMSLVACNDDATTPEGLLTKFITDITTKKLDKDYFEKYTNGKMLEEIEQLNEDEFDKYTALGNIKKPKISVLKKSCDDDRCSLTYVVKYDHHGKIEKDGKTTYTKAKEFESEVKKLAIIVKAGETWKIQDVTNLKTYHEAVSPIEVKQ